MVPVDDDDDWEQRHARSDKIVRLIVSAFKRIGLDVEVDGVYYDETPDRQAHVTLDDNDADLRLLTRLFKSGLSDQFTLTAGQHTLMVEFKVSPLLDQAL